jgi:hypothetical protein
MAAKNKSTRHDGSAVNEILMLHIEATVRHRELVQEGRDLVAEGKTREARKRLQEAEELHARITALEENSGAGSQA